MGGGTVDTWQELMILAAGAADLGLAARLARSASPTARPGAGLLLVAAGIAFWFAARVHPSSLRLAFLPLAHPLAVGPLVYLYVRARLGMPAGRYGLHFVVPAASLAYQVVLVALPDAALSRWKEGLHDHLVSPVLQYLLLASMLAYSAAAVQISASSARRPGSESARREARAAGLGLALLAGLLSIIRMYNWFVAELPDDVVFYFYLALAAAPLTLAMSPGAPAPLSEAERWRDSGTRWRREIQEQGWWRDPDLALPEAARRLGTNETYLSRALNKGLGTSFAELVNGMRAAEVARRIREGSAPAGLLDLALEAGFNSKATFNRAFREAFGCSPSAYAAQCVNPRSRGK